MNLSARFVALLNRVGAAYHAALKAGREAWDDPSKGDICARPMCLSPRHYNIHSVERGGHDFVEQTSQPIAKPAPSSMTCPHCKGPWRAGHMCSEGETAKWPVTSVEQHPPRVPAVRDEPAGYVCAYCDNHGGRPKCCECGRVMA